MELSFPLCTIEAQPSNAETHTMLLVYIWQWHFIYLQVVCTGRVRENLIKYYLNQFVILNNRYNLTCASYRSKWRLTGNIIYLDEKEYTIKSRRAQYVECSIEPSCKWGYRDVLPNIKQLKSKQRSANVYYGLPIPEVACQMGWGYKLAYQ